MIAYNSSVHSQSACERNIYVDLCTWPNAHDPMHMALASMAQAHGPYAHKHKISCSTPEAWYAAHEFSLLLLVTHGMWMPAGDQGALLEALMPTSRGA